MAAWGIKKIDLPEDYVLVSMDSYKGITQVQKDLGKPLLEHKNMYYVIDGKTVTSLRSEIPKSLRSDYRRRGRRYTERPFISSCSENLGIRMNGFRKKPKKDIEDLLKSGLDDVIKHLDKLEEGII